MSLISKIAHVSIASLIHKLEKIIKQTRYASHSHPKTFNWNWEETHYNRIALVNMLVANTKGWDTVYLEIGCARNALFDSVPSSFKVGVDPASGGTERTTSDKFFERNTTKFDVIFIDGLHHYEQIRKDAINALECINIGGWIAFHDFLPRDWKEQHVPRLQGSWCGDGWKVAVELNKAKGVEFKIIQVDYGVGLLQKISTDYSVPDMRAELVEAEFDVFVENVETFPLVSFEEAVRIITSQ